MAYVLQDEKVREIINHERLLKMLDRGIDDLEARRELTAGTNMMFGSGLIMPQ